MIKSFIKKLTPEFVLSAYHWTLAKLAAFIYGNPSNKLTVIGVTGTNGKSTVVNILGHILETAGHKAAWATTTNFHLPNQQWLNDQKMTMLGRFKLQKFLRQAIKQGCTYAVIETSSEGIKQFRHLSINYDCAIFTNLTPEHIESHGSFENYKEAKGKLFKHLTKMTKKGSTKTIIANLDDEYAEYFLNFEADKKITFGIEKDADIKATDIKLESNGTLFKLKTNVEFQDFKTNLIGKVNIYNILAAVSCALAQNIDTEKIKQALLTFQGMPGRFEFIETNKNFKVMVDYAPEPASMHKLYETLHLFKFNNIIHVLGSCGGGRDVNRRPVLGKLAATNADFVIVTNEDPYDDDPEKIIEDVADGVKEVPTFNQNYLFKITDRKKAIAKALALAEDNDLVLITGKGSEQFICVAKGQKIPWDDRKVVKELLNSC